MGVHLRLIPSPRRPRSSSPAGVITSVAHRSDSSRLARRVYRERGTRTRKGVNPARHLLRQSTRIESDHDGHYRVVTRGPRETGGGTGLAAVDAGSTFNTNDTHPSETEVFGGLSPAEAGLLTDLVRSARSPVYPDRYTAVTIAERDAFLDAAE